MSERWEFLEWFASGGWLLVFGFLLIVGIFIQPLFQTLLGMVFFFFLLSVVSLGGIVRLVGTLFKQNWIHNLGCQIQAWAGACPGGWLEDFTPPPDFLGIQEK